MTDIQLLTIVITLLAVFGSMLANRKSLEDMRDVLRAEMNVQSGSIENLSTELRSEAKIYASEMKATLQRIENKLDHVAATVATHSERLERH